MIKVFYCSNRKVIKIGVDVAALRIRNERRGNVTEKKKKRETQVCLGHLSDRAVAGRSYHEQKQQDNEPAPQGQITAYHTAKDQNAIAAWLLMSCKNFVYQRASFLSYT